MSGFEKEQGNEEPVTTEEEFLEAAGIIEEFEGGVSDDGETLDAPEEPDVAQEAASAEPEEEAAEPEPTRSEKAQKLAELAKLEWEAHQEKKALKEQREEAEKALSEGKKYAEQYEKLKSAAKTNKFAALRHLGIDPNELLDDIIKAGKIPEGDLDEEPVPADPASPDSKLTKLEQTVMELQAQLKNKEEEQQIAAFEKEAKGQINALLTKDENEVLQSIPADNLDQIVYDKIVQHAEKTGELLTAQQAVDIVKTAWEQDLALLKSNPKFLALVTEANQQVSTSSPEAAPSQKGKSLSNRSGSTPKRPKADNSGQDFSDQDLYELANDLNVDWGS